MKWNRVTDQAIRILIYLAQQGGVNASNEIALHLGVKQQVVMQCISFLQGAGFIDAIKGVGGGYYLIKEPTAISLYDVIVSIESADLFPKGATAGDIISIVYSIFQQCSDGFFKNISIRDVAFGNVSTIEKAKKKALNEVIVHLSKLQ